MPGDLLAKGRFRGFVVPACMLAQAVLLMTRLDLLPVWGDESFTLGAASQPVSDVLQTIAVEKNNPPLHTLLVHFWLSIPWPVSASVAARALSVVFAVLSTWALDRLWGSRLDARARLALLFLWTLSPCVLLYARMARSYSLQVLLFTVAVAAATKLLQDPRRLRTLIVLAALETALLYTHYLPGLALVAGVTVALGWRAIRLRDCGILWRAATNCGVVLIAFVPWLLQLTEALGRMASPAPRPGAGSTVITGVVRLSYWLFSFFFGETPPNWVVAGAALAVPALIYLVYRGLRPGPEWLILVTVAGLAAYAGAGRWVAFAFVPARLLFLLPFTLLALAWGVQRSPRLGGIVCAAMLVLSAGSLASYFRKSDFLNKGYLLPYREIARFIEQQSPARGAVVVADTFNTDPWPLARESGGSLRLIPIGNGTTAASLVERLGGDGDATVWFFRNTHDASPGGLTSRLERTLSVGRQTAQYAFVDYEPRDRLFMRLLGWQEQPTHFVQLLEIRPR